MEIGSRELPNKTPKNLTNNKYQSDSEKEGQSPREQEESKEDDIVDDTPQHNDKRDDDSQDEEQKYIEDFYDDQTSK